MRIKINVSESSSKGKGYKWLDLESLKLYVKSKKPKTIIDISK